MMTQLKNYAIDSNKKNLEKSIKVVDKFFKLMNSIDLQKLTLT